MHRMVAAVFIVGFGVVRPVSAQELISTVLQDNPSYLEPVCLRVTYHTDQVNPEPPVLHVLLDGKRVNNSLHGPKPYVIESNSRSTTFEHLLSIQVPPKAGVYELITKEFKSGKKSQAVRITVCDPTDSDKAVSKAIDLFASYVLQSSPQERDARRAEGETALRTAIASYPTSRMTRYARYHLFMRELDIEKEGQRRGRDVVVQGFRDLASKYGNLANELPSPSTMHCEATLKIAYCLAWSDQLVQARDLLVNAKPQYGSHEVMGKELQGAIESIDSRIKKGQE